MNGFEKSQIRQTRKVLAFEDSHTLSNALLKVWVEAGREAIGQRGRFTTAFSGGRSPVEFFSKLSGLTDFQFWQRVHIFWGDERFVPSGDDASNFRMIKENLLDYINIPMENIHPISTDCQNVILAADQYANDLIRFFEFKENAMPRFDFILLGVGVDGHTASLFPDDPQLDGKGCLVLGVSLPRLKEDRISLSLELINNARYVAVLGLGAAKADVIKSIIEDAKDVPVARLKPVSGRLTFFLDKDAARKLSCRDAYSHADQAVCYEFGI